MNSNATPLTEKKRLTWIDAARGFAIFGIFMVNVPAFNAPYFLYGGEEVFQSSTAGHVIQTIIDIFFQSSFYTLFSFLFGFGIQIIVENIQKRQQPVNKLLFRRLVILIGFGLIHAFFIWHGDILLTYGIIGMFLFLFFKRADRTLVVWALSLLVIPTLLYTGLLYLVRDQLDGYNLAGIQQAIAHYGTGSLFEVWQQNFKDWSYSNGIFTYIILIFNLLPLFLLGMVTARRKWLHDIERNHLFLKRVWLISFILFIGIKAGVYLWGNPTWLSMLQDTIGGSASAIFYLTSITLIYRSSIGEKLFQPFTYVGKMSLSNYIFQSVVCFILFYSVGFGLYGSISPLGSIGIVFAVYLGQIFLSRIYMERYRFGPLEWLWRRLMYMERLPNKR
ncbi:hypothetical protein GCM10011351_08570 [Paraliobacillus quinghaiensis]|uniref:DUF418 domain-containing protein n=1 Tax=Paraliobacillus quinghaiensis TaxID=470815 RepID=A0A917TJG9_9BACI|nr:DUF418 domain-containing protein [Paraliobacillus quinghaiensis]GGM25172.1 hypothetical protein GCM10011351_08570 [Paraliobacillus quinghaiensis]